MSEIISILPPDNPTAPWWTIKYSSEYQFRNIRQNSSGGNHCAIITLCIEPYHGPEEIAFMNLTSTNTSETTPHYIERILEGIREVILQKAEDGTPLRGIAIFLTELREHVIDSRPSDFHEAGRLAMIACLEKNEVVQEQ